MNLLYGFIHWFEAFLLKQLEENQEFDFFVSTSKPFKSVVWEKTYVTYFSVNLKFNFLLLCLLVTHGLYKKVNILVYGTIKWSKASDHEQQLKKSSSRLPFIYGGSLLPTQQQIIKLPKSHGFDFYLQLFMFVLWLIIT